MAKEKKDPTEMSVEERLKALYQLQSMLSEIDKIKTLRGELPLEVQDLEDEIEGLNTRIQSKSAEIEEANAEITNRRNEIVEADQLIARYKEQIDNVRNNREYDTLTKEIEYQGLQVELCNKKIADAQTFVKAKTAEIEKAHEDLAERKENLDVKRAELEEIIIETRQEEETLREKAKMIEATIEPRLLNSFKRIRKNCRNGLGVVYVERDACGGCFNKIPPQRQLDIRMRKKIIVCEYCGRILVDPELAGVKSANAVEEKPKKTAKRSIRKKEA